MPFTLTAKFEVRCVTDDGATAVDGQTLIRPCVSNGLGATDHQAPGHQSVAQVQAQWDLCAIHKPSARQKAGEKAIKCSQQEIITGPIHSNARNQHSKVWNPG